MDSDAHSKEKVGLVGEAESLINRVGINKDRIVNIDGKLPEFFRFREYKKKNL